MIVTYSNNDFDFQPLMIATNKFLFKHDHLKDWFVEQFVQNFDEVHTVLAAFFYVCHQQGFEQFATNLNIFLSYQGI